MTAQMTLAWLVRDQAGETLGAAGLRPSPAHGAAEIVGGAFPGPAQAQAALLLIQTALSVQPQLYAYAGASLLPAETLGAAGLRPFSAYTRMSGPLPTALPAVPDGFRLALLSEVKSLDDRLAAQHTYADRIGHTHVRAEDIEPGAGGCDDALSRLAYDASGAPVGICRAWLEGEQVSFSTPGVRHDVRHTALRQALLLSVCQAAQAAGATRLTIQAWGDTAEERAEDLALGLQLDELETIYVSPRE